MFSYHGQGASRNITLLIIVLSIDDGCIATYLATVSQARHGGGGVLQLLCWLTVDLSVSSPSLYGGLGFQGADLGWNRCTLPGSLHEGRRTGQSDWQMDGGKDRKKKIVWKNPSGCETWANVELKQSMTKLFYSPLSTWAPEALCDVCVACLCACSAVHALQRAWEEMRDERGE